MSTVSKSAAMELIALKQDVADGWTLMPNGRSKRVKFEDNDVFGVADYVVWRGLGQGYRRKYVQVSSLGHRADKLRQTDYFNSIHLCSPYEQIELALYHNPHWEGRGKKKVWMGKTTWKRELV